MTGDHCILCSQAASAFCSVCHHPLCRKCLEARPVHGLVGKAELLKAVGFRGPRRNVR